MLGNLFFIAFGTRGLVTDFWGLVLETIEVVFLLEFVLTFFTSYSDRETSVEVFDSKKIALNQILHGPFFQQLIPLVPLNLIFKLYLNESLSSQDVSDNEQLFRNL